MARTEPTKQERKKALNLGKRFRTTARRKHPIVADLENIFQGFRQLRDASRDEGNYNGRVERPLWAAFLRGISGR